MKTMYKNSLKKKKIKNTASRNRLRNFRPRSTVLLATRFATRIVNITNKIII